MREKDLCLKDNEESMNVCPYNKKLLVGCFGSYGIHNCLNCPEYLKSKNSNKKESSPLRKAFSSTLLNILWSINNYERKK